jgi:hypothetical protein
LDLVGCEWKKRVDGRDEAHLNLLFPPEILYLSFRATGDLLVLDIEVFFKVFQLGRTPVDGSEAPAKVTHPVIVTPTATAVGSTVTPTAIAIAVTVITLQK